MAAASVSSTFLASARPSIVPGAAPSGSLRSVTDAHPGLFGDLVDGLQPAQQRLEPIEPQGILGVALRAGRVRVDLEKHPVDSSCHAGRRQRFDELGLTRRHAVAGAWELKAMRDVEHDWNTLLPHR